MKLFSERNPMITGAVGLVAVAVVVLAALEWQKLPFLNQGRTVSAYFADAGGLRPATASRSPVSRWERCPASNSTGPACW